MTAGPTERGFDHPALLYRDREEYLSGILPFIEEGLEAGVPVMVAVPDANLGLIRDALGPATAAEVTMHDMAVAGRNPGRIIPNVLLRFADDHAGTPVRIVGEPIWPGRDGMEYPACVQHEALINSVFEGRDAAVLCPYDVTGLAEAWIADAHRTHPVMAGNGTRWDSVSYAHPLTVAADFNHDLPDPPADAVWLVLDGLALGAMRRSVSEYAAAAGLGADRVADLALAANELTTNTVTHGGGRGTLYLWLEDGRVVCQVVDSGHIDDPLAGRRPPDEPQALSGRGLLLVNQVCDLVRIHTRPGATTVRVHMCL